MVVRCNGCGDAISFVIAALAKEWQLSSAQMGLIGSVSSIGMVFGAVIFGILADKIGRKNSLLCSLLVFSIGNGISAFSTSLSLFLVLRLLVGAGLGGELPVASTLISENTPTASRGRAVVLLESFLGSRVVSCQFTRLFCHSSLGLASGLIDHVIARHLHTCVTETC